MLASKEADVGSGDIVEVAVALDIKFVKGSIGCFRITAPNFSQDPAAIRGPPDGHEESSTAGMQRVIQEARLGSTITLITFTIDHLPQILTTNLLKVSYYTTNFEDT